MEAGAKCWTIVLGSRMWNSLSENDEEKDFYEIVPVYLESGQHSSPAQVDLEFLHSASVMYQPLGWDTCCSAGTWKAEGGMGAPGR